MIRWGYKGGDISRCEHYEDWQILFCFRLCFRCINQGTMERNKLLQLSKYLWEFPKDSRFDMRVPARIYASEKMLDDIFKDKSLDQLVNLTTLSWINRYSIVMPDAHEWYGSPIWWVFATRVPDWIISPGAVWYDINCWVRLLLSTCDADEISHKIKGLAQDMQFTVPSWVWKWHKLKISINELNDILRGWVKYLAKKWSTEII